MAPLRLVAIVVAMLLVSASRADQGANPLSLTGQSASGRVIALVVPPDAGIQFQGETGANGISVDSPQILYPAPSAAGFLAGVFTHGLLMESKKDKMRKKAAEIADKVWEPYREVTERLTYPDLARRWNETPQSGITKRLIVDKDTNVSDAWVIAVTPVYVMAQDLRSLTLDADISILKPNSEGEPATRLHVRVMSAGEASEDPGSAWMANQGDKLKQMSTWLFSEAMTIAVSSLSQSEAPTDKKYQTVRYLNGNSEKMERALVVDEACGRLLIKTLRGVLMSVPVKSLPSGSGNSCATG